MIDIVIPKETTIMAKIKIRDIAKDQKISREEMKKVFGGVEPTTFPKLPEADTVNLSDQIAGINVKIGKPIQFYPVHYLKSKT
jgi:hypothetical protein